MGYQGGGSFLPAEPANITASTPWNFVSAPTIGALATNGSASTATLASTASPTLTTPAIAVINDTNGVNRLVNNAAAKTIADGAATSLADIACPSGSSCGGTLFFLVQASDGTDFQAISGIATYAAVNKAGTLTLTITYVAANEAKAVSSGTLTLAWTFVTGTAKGTIKLQPTGSLTETSYTVSYTVVPIVGAVTIL